MKQKIPDYVGVTEANATTIATRLKSHGGFILIVEAGHRSFPPDHFVDAKLDLFQGCQLEDRSVQASWGDDWVAKREKDMIAKQAKDRHYWLRRKDPPGDDPLWEHLVNTKERLVLTEDYGLEISPQSIVSRGYLDEGSSVFYVPAKEALPDCFIFAITSTVALINDQARTRGEIMPLTGQHIDAMVRYILEDLVTGAAMQKNLKHGQMADAILGM